MHYEGTRSLCIAIFLLFILALHTPSAAETVPLSQNGALLETIVSWELEREDGSVLRSTDTTTVVLENTETVSINGMALRWHGTYPLGLSMPGLEKDLTQQYIKQYSSPAGLAWLKTVMTRGKSYLPFIRKEIEDNRMPPELAFLPVIESAFLPTAISRSGAAGLWQFMRNSIHGYDIEIDEWRDDRRDFWKSTQAALKKLQYNYDYFDDWPLALAAYNAGLGAVQKAVQRAGSKDYWILCEKKYLKQETIHYVPKFLAIASILMNPSTYGLESDWMVAPDLDRIPVGRMVDLKLLEEKAGIETGLLKTLNPELLYGITPPDPRYTLKVPVEYKDRVVQLLSNRNEQLLVYYFHTIHSGDTLSALSRHYGVSVEQIKQANPGIQDRYLQLGKKIRIPALKNVGPYERPVVTATSIAFEGTHVVQKGETLWAIALAYEVDPEVLATVNGLTLSSLLREGFKLKTPIKKGGNQE